MKLIDNLPVKKLEEMIDDTTNWKLVAKQNL